MRLRLVCQAVLVILLTTTLAGCTNAPGPAEEQEGELKYGYVDADNKTHGLVAGVILTVAGEPLPDALVTILSVDGSVRSDPMGRFNFTGVAKGEQTLRVEKQGHKTLQRPFTVAAGKIVELEVVLARVEGLRGGEIDHYHDHWRGQEVYSIYEGRLDLTVPPVYCGVACWAHAIVLETGRIVPPGTQKISIDISFQPSPMFDTEFWRFRVYPPPGPLGEDYGEKTWILGTEEHVEYEMPSAEITDHGHAKYTNWGFALLSDSELRDHAAMAAYNALFPTSADVTITAHKGELVLDPPHPQYWADADRIEMPLGPGTYVRCAVPGAVPFDCVNRGPNPDVDNFGGSEHPRTCQQAGCMVLDRGGLVPPGTTRISFDLELWREGFVGGTEPPDLDDTDWVLGFKTAAPQRDGATWDDYMWVEPVDTYDASPQDGRFHQQGLRYMIELPEDGEDPYYTVYSGWVFMMAVRGHETASDYSGVTCSTELCADPHFQMKNFVVHNDAPASGIGPG